MSDDRNRIREIAWMELFPWLGLVRAVRLAFAPRMLILAAVGLYAMMVGWQVIGGPFRVNEAELAELNKAAARSIEPTSEAIRELQFQNIIEKNDNLIDSVFESAPPPVSIGVFDPAESDASKPWNVLSAPVRYLFGDQVDVTSFLYFFGCAIWAGLVWSLFGAAITRSAALWFAREDRLGLRQSLGWGVVKWKSYFGASLFFPFVGVLFATAVPAVFSWIFMRWDIGLLLMAILWPLMLLCGFFLAILLVGLLFGWPLMWPTISTEGTDSFDALGRSYSYTYQRPVHYLFYAAVAGVLGALAWVVVIIFANGVITYSYWVVSWGGGVDRIQEIKEAITKESLPDHSLAFVWGVRLIGFWLAVVKTLAAGFLFSYFWWAATYIYFLLRQAVDATEMDEVAVDEEPDTYGLPPLETAAGVPQVVDPPPMPTPPTTPTV